MLLLIIFMGILALSIYSMRAKAIGIFVNFIGFAMLTSSLVLGLWLMLFGIVLFIGIRGSKGRLLTAF